MDQDFESNPGAGFADAGASSEPSSLQPRAPTKDFDAAAKVATSAALLPPVSCLDVDDDPSTSQPVASANEPEDSSAEMPQGVDMVQVQSSSSNSAIDSESLGESNARGNCTTSTSGMSTSDPQRPAQAEPSARTAHGDQSLPVCEQELPTHSANGFGAKQTLFSLALVGVAVIAFFLNAMLGSDASGEVALTPTQPYLSVSPKTFEERINHIRTNMFPTQPERTWKAVLSRGRHHLQEHQPTQPAVFLLAAETSRTHGNRALECFAHHLATAFTNNTGTHTSIHAPNYKKEKIDSAGSMETIHREVKSALSKQLEAESTLHHPPVLIIQELGSLPAPTPFLFLSFCDSSHAEYPNAVFIFTLSAPPEVGLSGRKRGVDQERAVLDYLTYSLWTEDLHEQYQESSVEALVARLSDVFLIVEDGDVAVSSECTQ